MKRLFKLKNQIKHYDWGSPAEIPHLLGAENPEHTPWAELWMGIHPEGPSETADPPGLALAELIRRDPARYLGPETQKRFGTLPFLFKLLAVEKPLSIQAHPNRVQAAAGFARENQQGIPRNGPNRNYKDPNHKPELLCALWNFWAMAGFREPPEIAKQLGAFVRFTPDPVRQALESLAETLNLRGFFRGLFALSPETLGEISAAAVNRRADLRHAYPEYTESWETAAYLAELYPGDPGILAPLYLNVVYLQQNQGIYLPPGVLHGYISGFGLEVMANSDNVLRGGLTSKHIDPAELLDTLDFTPFCPAVLEPHGGAFPVPCPEFGLRFLQNQTASLPQPGPYIVIVTEGEAHVRSEDPQGSVSHSGDPSESGEDVSEDGGDPSAKTLKKGESAYIPNPQGLLFSGDYTLYAATVGEGADENPG